MFEDRKYSYIQLRETGEHVLYAPQMSTAVCEPLPYRRTKWMRRGRGGSLECENLHMGSTASSAWGVS